MSEFDRRIAPELLGELKRMAEEDKSNWWKDLLSAWAPSGFRSDQRRLRLAIRNGYLNFYLKGQSVARVHLSRNKEPIADVHVKYTQDNAQEQRYLRLTSAGLEDRRSGSVAAYTGSSTLNEWMERAQAYCGDEKIFVDELITHNADVIDVEMGLPAFERSKDGKKVAPRMDLIAIEPDERTQRIVFWEAKMMSNPELRRREGPAKVVSQLDDYRLWLTEDNQALVSAAYGETCRLLRQFHDMASAFDRSMPELGAGVRRLSESKSPPNVDPAPRLVISDLEASESWAPHAISLTAWFRFTSFERRRTTCFLPPREPNAHRPPRHPDHRRQLHRDRVW
jgi:hypothetical protein